MISKNVNNKLDEKSIKSWNKNEKDYVFVKYIKIINR